MAEGFQINRTTKSAEKLITRLQRLKRQDYAGILKSNGAKAVSIYQRSTPVDTGRTAASYSYEVVKVGSGLKLSVTNSNVTRDGTPIPILIHYGHGTGTGGYVPARPFLDKAAKQLNEAVKADVERSLRNG